MRRRGGQLVGGLAAWGGRGEGDATAVAPDNVTADIPLVSRAGCRAEVGVGV